MSDGLRDLANIVGGGRAMHVVVAEALRRQIMLGRLRPGDSLPRERELSQQLGIGRTTLRKAIRALAEEGSVSTKLGRGGGTFVLEKTNGTCKESLLVFDRCKEAIEHTYEARLALEPVAARLAALRANGEQVQELEKTLEEPAPTVNAYHALDSRLHTLVAEASGNPLLLDAIENARVGFFIWANALWLNTDWQSIRTRWGDTGHAMETDHRRIVVAIAGRDPKEAYSSMERHLETGREQFGELLNQLFEAEARGDAGAG